MSKRLKQENKHCGITVEEAAHYLGFTVNKLTSLVNEYRVFEYQSTSLMLNCFATKETLG